MSDSSVGRTGLPIDYALLRQRLPGNQDYYTGRGLSKPGEVNFVIAIYVDIQS
jgi:hypothetical protein